MRQDQQQVSKDQPEVVRSTPVSVPPTEETNSGGTYRGGRDGVPEDALDDRGTFDDPSVRDERAGRGGSDDFHEPAPVPTAFGATTVGSAVAASALAGGRPEDERDPRGEDTARPGDGAPGRTDRFDDERADPTAADRLHRADPDGDHRSDPTEERDGGDRVLRSVPGDRTVAAGAAGYGRTDAASVDPDAGPTLTTGPGTETGTGRAGLDDADEPSSSVPADAARLFDPGTAQGFRDRWRDVQLRFVDDPKAAVGEAQSLVDEAIQALASALAAQKEKLGSWQDAGSADTEQLRVSVRQYRDFLDRVLGR
ncbi:hypothetical protein ACN28G_20245 [Micromonospora sp. WMMA1923]|uniref:hypothetical protein n=1 Tax=Micromonospora sp. WMMA1923 TaxID=3404125 RepID=UPI003B93CF2F